MEEDSIQNVPVMNSFDLLEDNIGECSEQNGDIVTVLNEAKSSDQNQNTESRRKRGRDENEDEDWIVMKGGGKRHRIRRRSASDERNSDENVEAYISSAVELPKQFAFARLMKDNCITNIVQIKYINPFKIKITFDTDLGLEKLLSCQDIKEKGWRIYKTADVASSYGVIRKVELDLDEKVIMESIQSEYEILSVKRLTRRGEDSPGWVESESVRLCFKGPSLPTYVCVHGIRVRVDPYIFPVTQCSNCWKFGHPRKMCPRKKTVCPKCGKNHENCEATSFICVNCTGDHVALSKQCPAYLKERKIRILMADFNCTYQKAQTLYVPNTTPPQSEELMQNTPSKLQKNHANYPKLGHNAENQEMRVDFSTTQATPTYASILMTPAADSNRKSTHEFNVKESSQTKKKKNGKKSKKSSRTQETVNEDSFSWEGCFSDTECEADSVISAPKEKEKNRKRGKKKIEKEDSMTLEQLVENLKDLIFRDHRPTISKWLAAAQICFKWLVSFLPRYITDLPFVNSFFGL